MGNFYKKIYIITCGYILCITHILQSQISCSSNICRGYTEAAMELNRKWWWYSETSISVTPPRLQMLHLRCGRIQWWEQLLCCKLTGKTERMQKCQEREGKRTSDRNKDWGAVKDCLGTSSVRLVFNTLLARCVELSGIFTNKSVFPNQDCIAWASGPLGLKEGEKKDSQSKEQPRTDRLRGSRVNWKRGSSWTYFQASKSRFYSILIFKCFTCCLVIWVPNNRLFYPEITKVRSVRSLVWNALGLIDLTDQCFTTQMICNTNLFTLTEWSVLQFLRYR